MARSARARSTGPSPRNHANRARRLKRCAFAGLLLLAGARANAQSGCGTALEYGFNPSFQTSYSRAIVFADAFQRVRRFTYWDHGPQDEAPLIPLGSRLGAGWPDPAGLAAGERYGAILFVTMERTIPDGRVDPYVVTWRGAGDVRLEGVTVAGEQNRTANRFEARIDPTLGSGDELLAVTWTASDPADPIRDVRVWLPGMESAGLVFWPPFVEKVRATNAGRGPASWRTLDWTRVNEYGRSLAYGGFVFDLAGAITPASPSQGTLRGVAPQYQVALCNLLGMDLHFQLPHRANDLSPGDYERFLVDQLRIIRDGSPGVPGLFGGRPFAGLDPRLKVTLELSNEMWNNRFPVNAWMSAEAARKRIPFRKQVASQIQLLFDVADGVFTGPDAPRLRKYVAGFVGDPEFVAGVLAHLRPDTRVDAIGPAAYLAPLQSDVDAWLAGSRPGSCPNCPSADELFAAVDARVELLRPLVARHRVVAQSWRNADGSHPRLELYEAGLDLKAAGRPWAPAANALQTDPRVFGLFAERLVPMLVDEGVDLVHWYSFMSEQDATNVDAFGFWNDMNQTLTEPVARPYTHEGAPKAAVACYGPPLATTCRTATASLRSAPRNPNRYTATPPVLGGYLNARVDLTGTLNTGAYVIVSPTAVSTLLPSGQTLLVSSLNATFLPLQSGPIATWAMPIPNEPGLAGIRLATQAILVGGWRTNHTNAMDLVLGR